MARLCHWKTSQSKLLWSLMVVFVHFYLKMFVLSRNSVAVACFCGFTRQYPGFEELQKKFGDRFTVIAFPCNQFGGQEPGTPSQIKEFIKQFGTFLLGITRS